MHIRRLKNILLEYEEIILAKIEKVKGIDFSKRYVDGAIKHNDEIIHYESIRKRQFKRVFQVFCKETKNQELKSVLDYGSGKGYILYLLSETGYFHNVDGLEILPELCKICRTNLNKLGLETVKIINEDARDYSGIDDYDVYFMFNPFPEPAMKKVVAQIDESLHRKPRKISIIYVNNVHDKLLIESIENLVQREIIENLPRYGCSSAIYTNY